MINIMVVVSPEKLYTYRITDGKYELVHIHGDNSFPYQQRSAVKSVNNYIMALKEEFVYDTASSFSIKAAYSNESLRRGFVGAVNAWNEKNKERHDEFLAVSEGDFNEIAEIIFMRLEKDETLHINDLGVNIGIFCYRYNKEKITRSHFSLIAYTVGFERLGEFV